MDEPRKGPKRRKRPRDPDHKTRVTKETRKKFLELLARTRNATYSAEACGFSKRTAFDWKARDEEFAEAWNEALESSVDRLEQCAFERATDGWKEPVFYRGEEVGHITRHSPDLTKFMLERLRDDFRPRQEIRQQIEHRGQIGPPLPEGSDLRDYLRRMTSLADNLAETNGKAKKNGTDN